MKISIITPTVQRESLIRCCDSVDSQTFENWEHIVAIDSEIINADLRRNILHPRRKMMHMGKCWRNGGNTPRNRAWEWAQGDFVFHLDDDNHLADPNALQRLADALEGIEERWAIFPIHRHGSRFYFDPPQPCYFDTGNAIARREIAQWPDIDGYASDAVWLEELKKHGPYKAFPDLAPIMVMEGTSFGAGGGINGQ